MISEENRLALKMAETEIEMEEWIREGKTQGEKNNNLLVWAESATAQDIRGRLCGEFDREMHDVLIPFVISKLDSHNLDYEKNFPELCHVELFLNLDDENLFNQFFYYDSLQSISPQIYTRMCNLLPAVQRLRKLT